VSLEEAAAVKEAFETTCDAIQYVNDAMHQPLIVAYDVRIRLCLVCSVFSLAG